jgi:hypothetical protein
MRIGLFLLFIAAIACPHPGLRYSYAQPAPRNAAPAANAAAARLADDDVREELLLLYVIDPKTGELKPVLAGWTPEEVRRLLASQQAGAKLKETPFTFESVTLTGNVRNDVARLQCKMTIDVAKTDVDVPLGLSGWVLSGFKHPEPRIYSLSRDEKSGGYVCRIRAAQAGRQVLEFSLMQKLRVVGGERQLRLDVPAAPISHLTITTPLRAEGKATGGLLEKTTHSAGKPPTTEFSVGGLKRGFQLSWSDAGKPSAKVQQVIDVDGEIVATIDELSVRKVARLKLKSVSGATFRAFRVRLPTGAALDPEFEPMQSYDIEPVGGNGGGLYEIVLPQSTQGQIEISIATVQTRNEGQPVDLSGFEVLPLPGMSISRQGGVVLVHVDGDWNVEWPKQSEAVHRVDPPKQDADTPKGMSAGAPMAAFAYTTQPFSLAPSVRAKQKVVRVEPEYLFDVGSEEIRLQAVLKYHVRGAKAFDVSLDMPGWENVEAKLANVKLNVFHVGDEGKVVVELPDGKGKTGDFNVMLSASRKIAPQEPTVRWELPRPLVDSLDPAVVAVIAADNVNLKLDGADGNLALLALPPPFSMTRPKRQQSPLFYQVDSADVSFQAEMSVHEQQIEADVETEVTLDGDGHWQVSQKLIYRVRYKSTNSVTLDVPRSLIESEQPEIVIEGEVLPLEAISVQAGDPNSPLVPVVVHLPGERIGRFEVICRFPLGQEEPFTSSEAELIVPLVMPSGLTPLRNELRLLAGREIQVKKDSAAAPWALATEPAAATDSGQSPSLTSDIATHEAAFTVHRVASAIAGATNVDRVWIQSWLTGAARRDRVVFRFTSRGESVRLTLPEGVIRKEVRATLGVVRGDEIASLEATRIGHASDGTLTLRLLPVSSSERQYVLDLVYRFVDRGPGSGRGPGELRVAVPQFEGQIGVSHLYWQLVLPENEHVIVEPTDLTPEYSWGWQRLFWGRQPLRQQAELELWSGASPSTISPTDATSQYLFSAVGPRQQLVLRTTKRSWIVGATSLVVLVVGLLLIYLPAVRHSGVLLLVAVMLVALSWWAPATTILLAQAASVGLVLVLTSMWLVRSASRRGSTEAVAVGGTSSIIEISTTQLRQMPIGSSVDLARASTATALTPSQPSSSDSHS